MARRKKKQQKKSPQKEEVFGLSPETKRSIFAIFILAASVLIFLSFFEIAGSVGVMLDTSLAYLFGWDRFLVPVALILIGGSLLFPDQKKLSGWNALGFFFFFLSFNALLNLSLIHQVNAPFTDISIAGGYLGEFLGFYLPSLTGFWGALVIVASLLLVSLLLLFNTTWQKILIFPRAIKHFFEFALHLKHPQDEEEEEDVSENEEEEEEEWQGIEEDEERAVHATEASETEHQNAFHLKTISEPKQELVLTSKLRRKKVAIPLDILHHSTMKANSGDIEHNKEVIRRTLFQFGIDVEMGDTATGPTVTQYTLRPSQGVKLSRIVALQNDLALALAAHPIRIEAPIPKKSLVGIEVPNQRIATVTLRDVLESSAFRKRKSPLSFPLGKDVSGSTHVIALEKMPHMLIAGATGSGKSVCLNTLIISLLYQNSPDDLRLILIDPKRVELTAYAGIPHLLVPPITKAEDTINALKWTVREMERRLDTLSKFGARDIKSYNDRAEERMPKIVVAIDELADLMTSNGREVETSIVRIAQMARAVGIHLVLATQRPSVDVITGLIKANFPARIAFAVASQTDSRTILDMAGAEKLLGRGDMLFTSAELSKPKRLQGAFVTETEVEDIVQFLKNKGLPDYNHAITEGARSNSIFGDSDEESDPLIEDAIQAILEGGRASTSFLQRRLRLGYARAARMMDLLEEMGVISAGEGAKPREILITEWPPGGDLTEGMPTIQSEFEAEGLFTKLKPNYSKQNREEMEEEEIEEDEDVDQTEDEEEEDITSEKGEEEINEEEEELQEEEEEEEEEVDEADDEWQGMLEDEDDYLKSQEGDYLDE